MRTTGKNRHLLAIIGGTLLLCAALLLLSYLWEDYRASRQSEQLLQQIQNSFPADRDPLGDVSPPAGEAALSGASLPEESAREQTEESELPVSGEPLLEKVLGILEIPTQEIVLPVLNEYSEDLLRQAPCRYGAEKCRQDQIVIAGHNYKSHFHCLSGLRTGDEVLLTDLDGSQRRYVVSAVETLSGSDRDGLFSGSWEMTLFTCAADRQDRIVVCCLTADRELSE